MVACSSYLIIRLVYAGIHGPPAASLWLASVGDDSQLSLQVQETT